MPTRDQKMSKYHAANLLPALRLFIKARNAAVDSGFTDNGGAIHSVERILDILAQRLRYPHLRHINNIKNDPTAESSVAALEAQARGEPVFVEHVCPQRAFAREVIDRINAGASDEEITAFIKSRYRLVVLSAEETVKINRQNRSRLSEDRIADAGFKLRILEE